MKQDGYQLYETAPAEEFSDAHLLGNGWLGASVYGGIPYEKILINHDTLWSGQENDKISKNTLPNFPKARQLTLDGKVKEATTLINDEMLGYWSESFLPLGHLNLTIGHTSDLRTMVSKRILENDYPVANYRRTLTLADAVERIEYDQRGRHYTREMFVSHPDGVMAIRLTATGGSLDFSLSMDSPLRHEQIVSGDGAAIIGRAPDRVEPYGPRYTPNVVYREDAASDSIRFAAAARVIDTDGKMYRDDMRMYVAGASYAVVLMTAGTNFVGAGKPRDKDARRVLARCEEMLQAAGRKGYDALMAAHVKDYAGLYGRFSIDLGQAQTDALPTTRRMQAVREIEDPAFAALIMQYTRYLLIAFSRPGTQAGNLQGIWNPSVYPSWACNYTTNINVQMNYWPAEIFGLSECHLPMSDLVVECAESGRRAARALYNMNGWVTHHNTDLWRFAALAGEDASWAWWPFGGAWMCAHLWQHYEFTQDQAYLREVVYPVLRGAAEFLCDFVVKDAEGHYVTAPSTSPENKFFIHGSSIKDYPDAVVNGNRFSPNVPDTAEVCKAATMDLALIREVFGNLERAVSILGIEEALSPRMKEILTDLMPFKVGRHGQLQEWDEDYEECSPGMAHDSHLYPVYPGQLITREGTPELFAAAYNAMVRRVRHGSGKSGGWPGAWCISLWARFGEAELCNELNTTMPQNLGANLLTRGAHQIDAIMGWGAGLGEMLLQSHQGKLELLPALPAGWRNGEVCGLRARGGYEVDIRWAEGTLMEARITSHTGGACTVTNAGREITLDMSAGETRRLNSELGG